MNPYVQDQDFTLYVGDVREVLAGLPAESVHCVVTSPPYWGLRDYGTDGQLGLEPTPELYVENMVQVFREVRRVLRKDGTCWLNIGDSYAGSGPSGASYQSETTKRRAEQTHDGNFRLSKTLGTRGLTYAEKKPIPPPGLKAKDLVGIPWRLAFALQQDGWYLRSEIIWAKPNPMPESVTDRPTKSHEQVFLLTRSPRYFYDADAVREPHSPDGRLKTVHEHDTSNSHANYDNVGNGNERWPNGGRNLRSVWQIATEPYPDAHFATFPQALVEPCVKAGTSERGCCPVCGAPWERETETTYSPGGSGGPRTNRPDYTLGGKGITERRLTRHDMTTGWLPSCECRMPPVDGSHPGFTGQVPCVVLDPFLGSGTVALVARKHGRRSIGIELSPEYAELAARRLSQLSLLTEAS